MPPARTADQLAKRSSETSEEGREQFRQHLLAAIPKLRAFALSLAGVAGVLLGQYLGRRSLTQELAEQEREAARRKARQTDT